MLLLWQANITSRQASELLALEYNELRTNRENKSPESEWARDLGLSYHSGGRHISTYIFKKSQCELWVHDCNKKKQKNKLESVTKAAFVVLTGLLLQCFSFECYCALSYGISDLTETSLVSTEYFRLPTSLSSSSGAAWYAFSAEDSNVSSSLSKVYTLTSSCHEKWDYTILAIKCWPSENCFTT